MMTRFRSDKPAQKPASNQIQKVKVGKKIGIKLLENFAFCIYIELSLENTLIHRKKKKKEKPNSYVLPLWTKCCL